MFGLTEDHRLELARSIRGYLEGENTFKHAVKGEERLMDWAARILTDDATEKEYEACRHLAFLPYTQPEIELSPIRFATWCAAIIICNGVSFSFVPNEKLKFPTVVDAILAEIR